MMQEVCFTAQWREGMKEAMVPTRTLWLAVRILRVDGIALAATSKDTQEAHINHHVTIMGTQW